MELNFRSFLRMLESESELARVSKEVDVRYVPALVAESDQAVLFENLEGFDTELVSGLLNTRKRLAIAFGTDQGGIARRFADGIAHPIPPVIVNDGPVKEVVKIGDEVDLTELPIPLFHQGDGGPYITA